MNLHYESPLGKKQLLLREEPVFESKKAGIFTINRGKHTRFASPYRQQHRIIGRGCNSVGTLQVISLPFGKKINGPKIPIPV